MSKLERYLEFNWPKISDDINNIEDQAIAVMRHLDQDLGGKSYLIGELVAALEEATKWATDDNRDDSVEWYNLARAALAKAKGGTS